MPEERAINPYNFIPFGDGPERKSLNSYYSGELLSGWFDVNIDIRTPLIIPDGSQHKKEQNGHCHYKFFRTPDGEPAIPGSSLRGMLRSVYEAVTDSCLPLLPTDAKDPISQRTPLYAAFKDRGLLEYDKQQSIWRLYKAKAKYIKTDRDHVLSGHFKTDYVEYKNGQKVTFRINPDNTVSLGTGKEKGYIQFNIPLSKVYNVAVLQKGDLLYEEGGADKSNLMNDTLYSSLHTALFDVVHGRNNKTKNVTPQNDLLKELYRVSKDGGCVPCYYFIVEQGGKNLVYLSGAAAGRVRQKRRWDDIMGAHGPCKSLNELCPACALFGTIKDEGASGRVRFGDARVKPGYSEPRERTLPILSTPRTSSFEFYLRKPDPKATYWNFDYYGVRAYRKTPKGKSLEYTEFHQLREATPRGRKMYWHSAPKTADEKSNQNASMEAMDGGSFTFRVSFDRITKAQLGDIIRVITLEENDPNGKYCHKLGHGKPVGYGSVKLTIPGRITLREIDRDSLAVTTSLVEPSTLMNAEGSAIKALQREAVLRMAAFDACGENDVAYLTGFDNKGNEMIYSWFGANRVSANDVLTLPEPTDGDITLPTRRGKRSNGLPQRKDKTDGAEASRFPTGTVIYDAKVYSIKGPHVFFQIPDSGLKGHYFMKYNDDIIVGDYWDVKVVSYNSSRNQLEVEVIQD